MAAVTSDMVKELRDASGAGVMECKRALEEADGNLEKAQSILRERGIAAAAKKQERETYQGVVESYIPDGGRTGVLAEVNCETDFVAKTDKFKNLAGNLARHIEASVEEQGTPVQGSDVEAKLLEQPFTAEPSKTVNEVIKDAIATTGENIKVSRYVRFARENPGVLESYIHAGGRIGVLVEVNSDSDAVAESNDFKELARDIAMQVAAMNPQVIAAAERTADMEGADSEIALLEQPFIKDMGKTIGEMVKDSAGRTGENIKVSRFARFELGA